MKTKLLLLASTMLFAAACTNALVDTPTIEEPTSGTKLTATTESATRTALSPFDGTTTYHVNWQSGDQIYIYDSVNNKIGIYSTTDDDTTQATFRYETREGTSYGDCIADELSSAIAFYPASDFVINSANYPVAYLPAIQSYVANNVSGFPMYAIVDKSAADTDVNISFTNMCGIIRLNLSDVAASPQTITDVSMFVSLDDRANDSSKFKKQYALNGEFGVDVNNEEPFLNGRVVDENGNPLINNLAYQISLDCSEGVQLSDTATPFYVAVPPATFGEGFKIEITLADGHVCYVLSKNPITVERSKITDITLPLSHFRDKRARLRPGMGTKTDGWYKTNAGFCVYAKYYMDLGFSAPNGILRTPDSEDTSIKKIEVVCESSYSPETLTPCIVSIDASEYTIYAENAKSEGEGILKLYTEGKEIMLNPDSRKLFNQMQALASVEMTHFDTSLVTDMGYMFSNCQSLTSVDLSTLDISKVTDMSYMFNCCKHLTNINLGKDFVVAPNHEGMFNLELAYDITAGTITCSPEAKTALQDIVPKTNYRGDAVTWTWIDATTGESM